MVILAPVTRQHLPRVGVDAGGGVRGRGGIPHSQCLIPFGMEMKGKLSPDGLSVSYLPETEAKVCGR